MIIGVGCDLLNTDRLAPETLVAGDAFYERAFSGAEKAQALEKHHPHEYLAGRFCAKEAVYKAVSWCGEEFHPGDIEVLDDDDTHPSATLAGSTASAFDKYVGGDYAIHVSISYEDGYVNAFAVAERR